MIGRVFRWIFDLEEPPKEVEPDTVKITLEIPEDMFSALKTYRFIVRKKDEPMDQFCIFVLEKHLRFIYGVDDDEEYQPPKLVDYNTNGTRQYRTR